MGQEVFNVDALRLSRPAEKSAGEAPHDKAYELHNSFVIPVVQQTEHFSSVVSGEEDVVYDEARRREDEAEQSGGYVRVHFALCEGCLIMHAD